MVRPTSLTHSSSFGPAIGCAAALAALVLWSVPLGGQAAAPSPADARAQTGDQAITEALASLLNRAATTQPGTYSTVAGGFEPLDEESLPLVVQIDTIGRADQADQEGNVRAAVALGAVVPQPARTLGRIVAAGTPRVVVAEVSGSSPAGAVRSISQVRLRPGEYELQGAVGYQQAGGGVTVAFTKSRLVVPDLRQGTLALSPVLLGDNVAAAPAATDGAPFVFGPSALRPAVTNRVPRTSMLRVAFRVFNWTAKPEEKPDLLAKYIFSERTPRQAVFFNKVKPQRLNKDTLGERFDSASGSVDAGMTIPLTAFPFSDFQLTVRVTDNRSKQTASQDVRFVVEP